MESFQSAQLLGVPCNPCGVDARVYSVLSYSLCGYMAKSELDVVTVIPRYGKI